MATVRPDGHRVNTALNGKKGDHRQAHHLIPEEVWGKHAAFFKDIGMEGKRDIADNGLLMPDSADEAKAMKRKFYHCGSHGVIYSPIVDLQVTKIESAFSSGEVSATGARDKIAALQQRLRLGLSLPGRGTQRER